VLVFSKARRVYDRDDVVLVVANRDPRHTRDPWIHLRLGPDTAPVHIVHVQPC
jgi:starch synthase (maltosyl-transferring)